MLVMQLRLRPVIICVMCHETMLLCRCFLCLSKAPVMRDWWRWFGGGGAAHRDRESGN